MQIDPPLHHQDTLRLLEEVRDFLASWPHPAMKPWIDKINAHVSDPTARLVTALHAEARGGRFFPSGAGYHATMHDGVVKLKVDPRNWGKTVQNGFTLGEYIVHHIQLKEGLHIPLEAVHVRDELMSIVLMNDKK